MFAKTKTPVIGLVENMSVHICENCGYKSHIFGEGGVMREADKLGVPLLAQLPIDLNIRLSGDGGKPVVATEASVSEAFKELAQKVVEAVGVKL